MPKSDESSKGTLIHEEPKIRLSNTELVDTAIQAFATRLVGADGRPKSVSVTVAEFIRLLELQKQIGEDEPKEIRASWIESSPASTDQ